METPKIAEFICLSLYLTCEYWTNLASNLAICLCFVVETLGFKPTTFLPGPESCWKCICSLWVMTLLMSCRSSPSYGELKNEAEFYISIVTEKKKKVKLSRAISSSKLTEITSVVKTCASSLHCDTCKGNDVKWNSRLSWRGTDLHDTEDFLQSCIWLIHSLEWFLIKWHFCGCQNLLWSLTSVEGKCGIVLTARLQKDFHYYLKNIFYFAVGFGRFM